MNVPNAGKIDNSPSPEDNNVYYANSICMNRNRDLNGDNEITPDEIRWYLPTSSCYIQIALAQAELPDPIVKFTDYDPTYFTQYTGERWGTFNFHYATSDYQYYWAEQAVNTGDNMYDGFYPDLSQAYTVRCVRNLGTDPTKAPVKDEPGVANAFSHDEENRIITLDNFTDESIRGYNYGAIASNDLSEPSSHAYKKFQYAKDRLNGKSDDYLSMSGTALYTANTPDWIGRWTNSINSNGLCGQYYEDTTNKSDLGEWRVPSAYEMALLWIEGILQNTPEMESGYVNIGTDDSYFLSSTHSYFVDNANSATNNKKYLGYHDYFDRKVMALDVIGNGKKGVRVRCVRDVR
jgi:hypothetical protein